MAPPSRTAASICRIARSTVAASGASASELPTQIATSNSAAGSIGWSNPRTVHRKPRGSPYLALARSIIAACCPVPQATSIMLAAPNRSKSRR